MSRYSRGRAHLYLLHIFLTIACIVTLVLGGKQSKKDDEDYYSLLNMSRESFDQSLLKSNYFKLAKKYHPDKNPDDPEAAKMFVKITEAYEALSDPEKRRIYDVYGKDGLKNGGSDSSNHQDIWKEFFGRGFNFGGFGGGFHNSRTPDSQVQLLISLKDAMAGSKLTVQLNRQILCNECKGVGAKRKSDIIECPDCQGHGMRVFVVQLGMGMIQRVQKTCDRCQGQGKIFKAVCGKCRGKKVIRQDEPLELSIQPGCPEGHVIKISEGADESPGMETGDLYVVVKTEPHPTFKRDGPSLYTEMTIGLLDALLGFKRTIKHLDGRSVIVERDGVTQPSTNVSSYLTNNQRV